MPDDGDVVDGRTNLPEAIDAAFLRPGRFDYVFTPPPTTAERAAILARRAAPRRRPCAHYADAPSAARRAGLGPGADLVALCQSAALRALRDEDAARARDDDAADAAKAGAKMRMRAAHFELALRDARPSTSATELQRFESWAAAHKDLAWA